MKYDIPVWQMVKNAVRAKGGAATHREVRDWVLARYPDVNPLTLRCQRVICTVNDPTRVNFTQNKQPRPANARYDFLYCPGPKRVVSAWMSGSAREIRPGRKPGLAGPPGGGPGVPGNQARERRVSVA